MLRSARILGRVVRRARAASLGIGGRGWCEKSVLGETVVHREGLMRSGEIEQAADGDPEEDVGDNEGGERLYDITASKSPATSDAVGSVTK